MAAGVLQTVLSLLLLLLLLFNCTLVIVLLFPNTQFVPPDSMVLLHDVQMAVANQGWSFIKFNLVLMPYDYVLQPAPHRLYGCACLVFIIKSSVLICCTTSCVELGDSRGRSFAYFWPYLILIIGTQCDCCLSGLFLIKSCMLLN